MKRIKYCQLQNMSPGDQYRKEKIKRSIFPNLTLLQKSAITLKQKLIHDIPSAERAQSKKRNTYRKYSNLVRTQVEIISDPNYLASSLTYNFQGT